MDLHNRFEKVGVGYLVPAGWSITNLAQADRMRIEIDAMIRSDSLENAIAFLREELAVLESEAAEGAHHSPRFPNLDGG